MIANYVIVDDHDEGLIKRFGSEHFVHVSSKALLTKRKAQEVIKKLTKGQFWALRRKYKAMVDPDDDIRKAPDRKINSCWMELINFVKKHPEFKIYMPENIQFFRNQEEFNSLKKFYDRAAYYQPIRSQSKIDQYWEKLEDFVEEHPEFKHRMPLHKEQEIFKQPPFARTGALEDPCVIS